MLGITAGAGLHFVPPATMAAWLEDEHLGAEHRAIDRVYPWLHHLVVARRPSGLWYPGPVPTARVATGSVAPVPVVPLPTPRCP